MLVPFRLFHFLMSLGVQWYLRAIELKVSPRFTTWVLVVADDDLPELLDLDVLLTCAMGAPER